MTLKFYRTAALPLHYVVETEQGERFLVPVDPIGPEAWDRRTPYRGNYVLEQVWPAIARFYLPS